MASCWIKQALSYEISGYKSNGCKDQLPLSTILCAGLIPHLSKVKILPNEAPSPSPLRKHPWLCYIVCVLSVALHVCLCMHASKSLSNTLNTNKFANRIHYGGEVVAVYLNNYISFLKTSLCRDK